MIKVFLKVLFPPTISKDVTENDSKRSLGGTSLAVQWLRLCTSTAEGVGSIPGGGGIKIPHVARCGQKKNKHLFVF